MNRKVLKFYNEWEHHTYKVDNFNIEVNLIKELYIDKTLVKFEVIETFKDYYDMGHTYTATSDHIFIIVRLFGTEVFLDLSLFMKTCKVEVVL